MNIYDIETDYSYTQKHCVVAENMGEAERVFKLRYPTTTIRKISLHSEYVQIQKYDEQSRGGLQN